MAASETAINSTNVKLEISSDGGSTFDLVGFCTNCTIDWSMDVRNVTTKDSGGRREILPGLSQWSGAFEGLVTYSVSSGVLKPNDLYGYADGKTELDVKFGSLTTGDYDYRGEILITQYSQAAGFEDNNTFNCSFEGDGALSQAAVS